MGNNKKKVNKENKNPTVSILTISGVKRQETIVLTAEHINNQSYKNIIEWVIVNGDHTLEDSLAHEQFIKNELKCDIPIVYIPGYHLDSSGTPHFNGNKLGELRNISNRTSKGDICVCFDDDDWAHKNRVENAVQMLTSSKAEIAGCSSKYLYDYSLQRLFKFKQFGPNHSTNDCMSYKRTYFENGKNSYDSTVSQAEEASWTNKFSNPMVQLDAKYMIGSSHTSNTFNKREICTFSCLWQNPADPSQGMMYPQTVPITETVQDLMGQELFDRYNSIFVKNEQSEFDISYLTGGTSIEWDPTSQSLGGSEQAVVNLSKEWQSMGKKVAVYAKLKREGVFDRVTYLDWKKFPFNQQHNTIILSRMSGVNCYLMFPLKAKNVWVDYHDNNFQFRHEYLPYTDKINKIFFKSDYHLEYYQEYFKKATGKDFVLTPDQYTIIPNGIRMSNFTENPGVEREPFRFCYCSCYTRGLIELLKFVWPIIYQNEPRAELHVYYGMEGIQDPNARQQITLLLGQPGVMDHGRQPVDVIAKEKWRSSFHLYLSRCQGEIDCISIRESLVAGCIPLISNFGVFKKRDGLHFEIDETQQSYQKAAVGICNVLKKPDFIEMARTQFKQSKTIVDWKTVADQWVEQT